MKKRIFRKLLIILGGVVGVILLALIALIVFLTVTEYRPEERQTAERIELDDDTAPAGKSLTVYSWNIGYAGLGKESDSFMDGGTMVNPPSQEAVEKNFSGVKDFIAAHKADAWMLQEVDLNSARTKGMDQLKRLAEVYTGNLAFAYNYKCAFVPIPVPPIGRVESGIATMTKVQMDGNAERVALPCPFSWPVRTANLKRCLLVTRLAVSGTDRELVLVNLHLEAYDDGEGKLAQTKRLLELLQAEYEKGNYVIAGGDFNQTFPGTLDTFPIRNDRYWTPGVMENTALPEGWQYAYDGDTATCRLLDRPYDKNSQLYVLDGFIVSPNVQIDAVEAVDLGFAHSDHNPVKLNVTLLEG
ncbi:MAG: endonuclease [Oscillospiraceae bacterium]|nr:endonuclease [Oscillospiraceae bacterium]